MHSHPAGGTFLHTPPTSAFIPEDFSGDEKLMIDTAEQFSRSEVLPLVERLDTQEDGLMRSLVTKAGQLGFCGIDSPEAYGGLGLGKNLAARILEYMSLNASFSVTYGITSGISQVGISLFGSHEQKSQYLPMLTSGEWLGAYALSEPNSGSDALSASTRAEFRGGNWVLNGTKMWISNAKWADLFLVMAKIDGEKFSAFLVERDRPGVSVSREEHKMGLKGSSTARLVLEDAIIPEGNLLYEPGLGHHVAFNALNLGRFKLSSMSMGPARDAIGLSARYAQDRRQFATAISEFGLIKQKFARMLALFFAAEAMTYRTGALIDGAFETFAGDIVGNRRAAEEYAIECSMCKVFATEAEASIIDDAIQVYGGYGFTEEFPIARHYRDARVSRIYEGTNEVNRLFIADRLRRKGKDDPSYLQSGSDGLIGKLATEALALNASDQIRLGACSDLLILEFALQSARIRAARLGGVAQEAAALFENMAHQRAAECYQIATARSVSIPDAKPVDWDALAQAAYDRLGPL